MDPRIVRHLILPVIEATLGRSTFRTYDQLLKTQWWSPEELRALQLQKLQRLIAVAFTNTSYYAQHAGKDKNWRPSCLEDLQQLPFMDKAVISEHREGMINRSVPGGACQFNTGGSSGVPLIFYYDRQRQSWDKAARMRAHEWWGILPGEREAYFMNYKVALGYKDRLKLFRDWLINDRAFSVHRVAESGIVELVRELHAFHPACLFGYPSSMDMMCRLATQAGLNMKDMPLKVVLCSSEVLYDHQRKNMSETFGNIPVADGYGSREGGFIAHECRHGQLHVTAESVILEFVKGNTPVGPGEDGELVVTHLDNHAMPFIRYRTGDIGQACAAACPCGRGLPVIKPVKGRSTDFVITPDGRWIHALGIIFLFSDIPGIRKYQVIQHELTQLQILLVTDELFPADGDTRIRNLIGQRVGPEISVSVEHVANIADPASGKHRPVISHVARARQALL